MRFSLFITRGCLAALSLPFMASAVTANNTPKIQEVCPPDKTGRRAVLFEPQYRTVSKKGDPYVCQSSEGYFYQPAHMIDDVTIPKNVLLREFPSMCSARVRRTLNSQTYGWVETGQNVETARPTQVLEDGMGARRFFDDRDHPSETPIQLRDGYADAYAQITAAPNCSWIKPGMKRRTFTLYMTDRRAVAVCRKDGSGVDTKIIETPSTRQVNLSGENYGLVKNKEGVIEEFSEYVFLASNKNLDYACAWKYLTPPKDKSLDKAAED